MGTPLKVLNIEDSADDALLIQRELCQAGFDVVWERVATADAMRAALAKQTWDVVISDFRMPMFDGFEALAVMHALELDLPFILVSGTVGEETAVAAMKAGAHDYIMKDKLARLAPAVKRELREAKERQERKNIYAALLQAKEDWDRTFDAVPDLIAIIDNTFRIVRANRAMAERLGLTPQQCIGGYCYEIVHGTERPPDFCPHTRMLENMTEHQAEITEPHLGGEFFVSASPLFDTNHVLIGGVHVARDITERKQAQIQLQESYEQILRTVNQALTALAYMAETRDPYTAGHQVRMTQLAVAIAREMQLTVEQQQVIDVAGRLHDIGKIQVPSDLLNRPGMLSEMEMNLIRCHAEASCAIIQKIELPWSISPIVLQHHERMDGSGYPQGLSGEQILLEARILAVADVVEAMASHRPYRPSLGIETALDEITMNAGTLYDATVVQACLHAFRVSKFAFI